MKTKIYFEDVDKLRRGAVQLMNISDELYMKGALPGEIDKYREVSTGILNLVDKLEKTM